MVIGEVAGLKSRELVMACILEGGCRDKMAGRLLRSYTLCLKKQYAWLLIIISANIDRFTKLFRRQIT